MESGKRSDIQGFKDWLDCHKKELQGLSPADIAFRAIQDGQDLTIVRQWQAHEQFSRMGKAS